MERTEFQQMMAELKEQNERRRYDALRKKYAIAPDFTNMSLYDELGVRYDLDELEQLKQKFGMTTDMPIDNALAARMNKQPAQQSVHQLVSGYPEVREDKRNTFNSAIESFVRKSDFPQTDNSFINQIVGAARDLGENYINMVNANHKSTQDMQNRGTTIDNYYHCIGNYDAAKRGTLGAITAGAIGLGRELFDYPKNVFAKGNTFQQANDDFINDMDVNADGRKMARGGYYASAYEACDKYRPVGYNPLDRFNYYKK